MSALIPGVTGAYMTTLSDKRVSPETKQKAVELLEELLHLQADPVSNGRERVIRAALTRLQSNADATGPRYDLRAKPQDARDKTELYMDFAITNEASEVFNLTIFSLALEINSKSMFGIARQHEAEQQGQTKLRVAHADHWGLGLPTATASAAAGTIVIWASTGTAAAAWVSAEVFLRDSVGSGGRDPSVSRWASSRRNWSPGQTLTWSPDLQVRATWKPCTVGYENYMYPAY